MSEFKFTKGEWVIDMIEDSNGYQTISSEGYSVATCYGGFEKTIPNAKLIACAPEMLEMLEELVFLFSNNTTNGDQEEAIYYSKKLIKKATE